MTEKSLTAGRAIDHWMTQTSANPSSQFTHDDTAAVRSTLERLVEEGVCAPADLRRTQRRVKSFSKSLPAFENVYIDALLSGKALTPYQADCLHQRAWGRLLIGPYIVTERTHVDGPLTVLQARSKDRKQRAALTLCSPPPEQTEDCEERLSELVQRAKSIGHKLTNLDFPHGAAMHDGELVAVGQRFAGTTLQEIFVRRGRFPVASVASIAKQLLQLAEQLEQAKLPHGDLRMDNILLTETGQVKLMRAGLRNVLQPTISVNALLPSHWYDATAPELAHTGRTTTPQSELYAIGCTLWQLLCGRPPQLPANPLEKLAAHQMRRIVDVREWQPDVPEELADLIWRLTEPEPEQRFQSAAEALTGRKRRGDRAATKQCMKGIRLRGPMEPVLAKSRRTTRIRQTALSLIALSLIGYWSYVHQLEIRDVFNSNQEVVDSRDEVEPTETSPTLEDEVWRLPNPNEEGIVELVAGRTYTAEALRHTGPMTIRAIGERPAVVRVPIEWHVSASDVVLQNLILEREANGAGTPSGGSIQEPNETALVICLAQRLGILGCQFRDVSKHAVGRHHAVAWQVMNEQDAVGRELFVQDSSFHTEGDAVLLGSDVRLMRIRNTLKTGAGYLFQQTQPMTTATKLQVELSRVTLREASGLTRMAVQQRSLGEVILSVRDSVFQLAESAEGLLVFDSPTRIDWQVCRCELLGIASRFDADASVPVVKQLLSGELANLEKHGIVMEGLIAGPVEFAGTDLSRPEASMVVDVEGPRLSSLMPGYQLPGSELPALAN